MSWVGGSGNWDDPSQWSSGQVPGSGDNVTIDTGATTATITIQASDTIEVQSLTTGGNDTLSIAGGSLTVNSGTSALSGSLSMSGGSLWASGAGAAFTASGGTSIADADLIANVGATLSLPKLTSYEANGNRFDADGAGSVLDVSALATLNERNTWSVAATNGGEIKLSDLAAFPSTQEVDITDTGGSTLLDGRLTTIDNAVVTLDGTDKHVADAWTKLTDSQLTVTGNPSNLGYSLPALTDVDQSNLFVSAGGQLSLPNVTSYTSNDTTFEADQTNTATGQHSVLNVSGLATLAQQGSWAVQATDGGEVKLSALTSLLSTQGIHLIDTNGSSLDLSSLTTFSAVSPDYS